MVYYKKNNTNNAVYCEIIINFENMCEAYVAHFLEHLIMKYNSVYTQDAIRKFRALYEIDAQTYTDHICFSCYASKEKFSSALQIISDLIYKLKFTSSNFKNEKNIIINEIQESIFDFSSINYCNIFRSITNLSYFNILGTKESVGKLSIKKIHEFYNQIISQPFDIYINGKIAKHFALKLSKKFFNCCGKVHYDYKINQINHVNEKPNTFQFILNYTYPLLKPPTITEELYLRNLQYFSDLIMNKYYKDENQLLYNFETNYIIFGNMIIFYFSLNCTAKNYILAERAFDKVLDSLKNLTSFDLEMLSETLKDAYKKHIETPNEQYVYENIKNYNKIITEKEILKLRIKTLNLTNFKKFISTLLNTPARKIITPKA